MTNEKMLKRCMEMAILLDEDNKFYYDFCMDNNDPDGSGLGGMLARMVIDLKADIEAEECRSAGRSGALNAAKRIIKSAKRGTKPALYGSWMEGDLQCYCDGFRGVRLCNPLPTEEVPEETEKMSFSNVIDTATQNIGPELSLPSIPDLKAHIKIEKAAKKASKSNKKPVYDFGSGLPMVDAGFLLDMLEMLPDCTATAARYSPELGAIYFKADAGDGVLLPVRKKKEEAAS